MQQKKWLIKIFILSIACNGFLFILLCFFTLREHFFASTLTFSFKPSNSLHFIPENHAYIMRYQEFTYDDLSRELKNKSLLEEGISHRTLALAILVDKYHFDIERALQGNFYLEKREGCIPLYSLEERDFDKIYAFIKKERYPFTTEGLFMQLKEQKERDPLLVKSFMYTPQFHLIRLLFQESPSPLDDRLLLNLLLEGEWSFIENFYLEQKERVYFSQNKRREFLVSYLQKNSSTAAYLLLVLDYDFVKTQMEIEDLITLFSLISKKTPLTVKFAKEIVLMDRADELTQVALAKVQEFQVEEGELSGRFVERPAVGQLRPVFREPVPKSPSPQQYVVQTGDSLWLIAKRHSIPLEELKRKNNLQTDIVRPGQTLTLP